MAEGGGAAGDRNRRVYYVDLVLGAWRAREAARQLAAALGLVLPPFGSGEARSGEAIILQSIEESLSGDGLVTAAAGDAAFLARALPGASIVVVLTPRYDSPLRAENEWLFFFLRRLGVSVAIVGEEPPLPAILRSPFERRRSVVAPEWEIRADQVGSERLRILALFPGLMARAVAETFGLLDEAVGLLSAAPDHFLIPTGYRTVDPRNASRDIDALEDAEAMDDGMRAFGLCHCSSYYAGTAALVGLAERARADGGAGLAADLAARARLVARTPADAALAETCLARLDLAAGLLAPPRSFQPSLRVPEPLRDDWRDLTVWADIASGVRARIEPHVAPLLADTAASPPPDAALRLHAFARACLAAGDRDRAFGLARRVAAALAGDGDAADDRLVYANQLTLARLHKLAGDAQVARAAVERAFAASLGARNLGEVLALNVHRAGTAPPEADLPFLWLRAALAWLGMEAGESLGRDAVAAILGDPDIPRGQLEVNVCEVLADRLAAAWPAAGGKGPERLPVVTRTGAASGPRPEKLFGAPGAAVLWTAATDIIPVYPPARARLLRAALVVLGELAPPLRKSEIGTLFVDINQGIDIPATRDEALSVALRHGLGEIVFGGEAAGFDLAARARAAAGLDIRLSPAVARIAGGADRMTVAFRRRLPPLQLSGEDAKLVAPLADGSAYRLPDLSVALGLANAVIEPALRRLERASVLRLDVRTSA